MEKFTLKSGENELGQVTVYAADEVPVTGEKDLVITSAGQFSEQTTFYSLLKYCDGPVSQAIFLALANQGKVVYSAELRSNIRRFGSNPSPYGQDWVRH